MMTEFMHGAGEDLRPSKSQRKRDMLALQELGRRLLDLSPERIARMDLPDDLAEAVAFYHTLKDKEARRRQVQFIGVVMRGLDPEPIRQALDALDQIRFQHTDDFHQLEEWRDALVAGDQAALEEVTRRFDLDARQVERMAARAAAERAAGKPSREGRVLFRLLRQVLEKEKGGA